MITTKQLTTLFKIIVIILLVWVIQVLFLNQAAKVGMNGWDDWGFLFYYDAYRGNDLNNFTKIINDLGTPYYWTEVYYIGPLKDIFGLHQTTFKLVEFLWKAVATLSLAYLVFRLTVNKLFTFLVAFFFVVFASTDGIFSHIVLSGGFLTVAFMCFSILFYIESAKKPKKLYLASLFFFLALLACPPRAYLLLPIPLIVELIRLFKRFRFFVFSQRLFTFYFSLVFLRSSSGWFEPQQELIIRMKQLFSGNLYVVSLPSQMISVLIIDVRILQEILNTVVSFLPSINPFLLGFTLIDMVLLIISIFLGFVIKGKKRAWAFIFKVMGATLVAEVIFYLLGIMSIHDNIIPYINLDGNITFQQWLNPTIYLASLGAYFVILGLSLSWEWWKYQRSNKILLVIVVSWLWTIFSEFLLFLTNSWTSMLYESNDKYTLVCSVGAVVFTAGIFTMSFQALAKIKRLYLRIFSFSLLVGIILMVSYTDYRLLNNFYAYWMEKDGGTSYWQDTMFHRFLDKFGRNNLAKPAFIYIDTGTASFNNGAFMSPIRYRIFYDEKGNLLRDNCKVVTNDFKIVGKSYSTRNGERGFLYDTPCVDANFGIAGTTVFYPMSDFYAYKIENKEFIDIKDNILDQLDQPD